MIFRLIGSHLIFHLALRQSQSMIPSLHSLLSPVVNPKFPYMVHSFLLSMLLLARWSQKIPQIPFVRWWHPTVLSLLQILLYLLKHLPTLSLKFFPGWTWTHCYSIHLKLNFFLLAQNNKWSYKLISQEWYHPSQFLCSQSWYHLWRWHVFLWSNQLCIQILSFSYPRHPSNSSSSSSFCNHNTCKFTCLQQTWLLYTIHFTLASHKQISTNFNAFKTHWHASSQTPQNINTSHQH